MQLKFVLYGWETEAQDDVHEFLEGIYGKVLKKNLKNHTLYAASKLNRPGLAQFPGLDAKWPTLAVLKPFNLQNCIQLLAGRHCVPCKLLNGAWKMLGTE